MKTLTKKEPAYAVDIVQNFDKTGEHLVWPFNRCQKVGKKDVMLNI